MTDEGPNRYPEPRTKAQQEALEMICRYLGKTFYEGDTICYRGGEWECASGAWVQTGKEC